MFVYPTSVIVAGAGNFAVNTDFRNVLKIFALRDEDLEPCEAVVLQLRLFYADFETIQAQINAHPMAFYNAMVDWILCYKQEKGEAGKKTLDYEQDWQMIIAAFQHDYNIALDDENTRLHWHKFISLLNGLNESNLICKVVGYRAMNLSDVKDRKMRSEYAKLKKQYALKTKSGGVMSDHEFDEFLKEIGKKKNAK
jgi:hypothetical protein